MFQDFKEAVRQIEEIKAHLVEINLSPIKGQKIEISSVWSHKERGCGHAGRAMRALFALADEFQIDLFGQPHFLTYDTETHEQAGNFSSEEIDLMDALNEQKLENDQLLDWYLSLGFVLTGDMDGDDPIIVRRANTPIPEFRPRPVSSLLQR